MPSFAFRLARAWSEPTNTSIGPCFRPFKLSGVVFLGFDRAFAEEKFKDFLHSFHVISHFQHCSTVKKSPQIWFATSSFECNVARPPTRWPPRASMAPMLGQENGWSNSFLSWLMWSLNGYSWFWWFAGEWLNLHILKWKPWTTN